MRVLHFSETLPGGPASYLAQLLPLQAKAYDSVTVLCPDEGADLLQMPGVRVIPFPSAKRTLAGLNTLYRNWRAHRDKHDYEIVHLHSSFAGAIGRAGLRHGRAGIVYCPHGWAMAREGSSLKRTLYGLVERVLSYRSDAIINISSSEESLAHEIGISPSRCNLIYNGIADAPWEPLPEGRQARRLLFVGRYDRQKGIDLLIDAMKELSSHGFELQTIGGSVVGKPAVTAFPSYIQNLGWHDPDRVHAAMTNADIIVIPSRWEGFGLVAAEAMRAGRPVLASAAGALPELIVDGETGILCAKDSAQAIEEGVLRLSGLNIRLLGINGRKRYEALFTAERMFVQLDNIYRRLSDDLERGLL